MATPAKIPKLEKDNYSRVEQGLGVACTALQDVLEKYIPHTELPNILRFFSQHRLDKQQMKLVKKCDTEGYKDFDISVLYKLLRNVCTYEIKKGKPTLDSPTLGWDRVPRGDHITLSDDIERLHQLRNSMHGHNAQAAIEEGEFRDKWQELKDICSRMEARLHKDYTSALVEMETYTMNELQLKDIVLYSRNQQARGREERIPTEAEVKAFQEELLVHNKMETERIPVTPLQKKRALSLEQLYVPLVIRQDLEYKSHLLNLDDDASSPPSHQPITDPRDMFVIDNNPARYVFVQGEAGRGKTVFCLMLIWYWCLVRESSDSHLALSLMETCMNQFDFVFLVQLRHMCNSHISVVDMICDYVFGGHEDCHDVVRHVLSSKAYHILIVLDGLDEWHTSDELSKKLKYQGVPNIQNISNSVVLFTSRPWKLELVSEIIRNNDRVLEIMGLKSEEIHAIVENVLEHFFKMNASSTEFKDKVEQILQKSKPPHLKSILQVPLMATASIHLWYANADVGNSMTTFYIALTRMLIKRTIDENKIDKNLVDDVRKLPLENIDICEGLRDVTVLKDFISLLCRLGKLAYEGLVLKETKLIFEETDMKDELGECALAFALKVGLFSHSEAPGGTGKLNLNFFHKTVQEFLSAIHIVSSKQVSVKSFLKRLTTIKMVLEFGNILTFISGLSPAFGYIISHHITDVANADPVIRRYREKIHDNNRVKLLYHLQLSCLREIQQTTEEITDNTQLYRYHISDVYVDGNSDTDTVRMTADVLRHHNTNIVSLYIARVPNDRQDGIDDAVIHDYLQQTTTLTSLFISGNKNRTLHTINTVTSLKALVLVCLSITPSLLHDIQTSLHNNTHIHRLGLVDIKCVDSSEVRHDSVQTLTTSFCCLLQNLPSCKHLSWLTISYMLKKEERDMLVNVLPDLSHLKIMEYYGSTVYRGVDGGEYGYTIVHMVSQWTQLQRLLLGAISLGDRSLELPADMDHIETVVLHTVKMSAGGWRKFITSLINTQHQFHVYLRNTDISADCVTMVRSSPHFTVTNHDKGQSVLVFTRKFQPTSQTQEHSDDVTDDKQST